jgi:hypothetical protein
MRHWLALPSVLLGVACVPSFDDDLSQVARARIVSLIPTPAEVKEGATLEFEAVVVAPDGDAAATPSYQLCVERKPLTELGSLSPACLRTSEEANDSVLPLGTGERVSATLPAEACRLFGPRRPDPKPGEAAGRPVDPDGTGGYYEPVVSWLSPAELVVGAVRLSCGLAFASQASQLDFASRYRSNENPSLLALELVQRDGSSVELGESPGDVSFPPGARVSLRAVWAACPREASCGDGVCSAREDVANCAEDCRVFHGCEGAESYAYYDPEAAVVVDRREGIEIDWYATAGHFAEEHTGRAESEPDGVDAWVEFTLPLRAEELTLWAVVRDDRGGAGYRRARLRVGAP